MVHAQDSASVWALSRWFISVWVLPRDNVWYKSEEFLLKFQSEFKRTDITDGYRNYRWIQELQNCYRYYISCSHVPPKPAYSYVYRRMGPRGLTKASWTRPAWKVRAPYHPSPLPLKETPTFAIGSQLRPSEGMLVRFEICNAPLVAQPTPGASFIGGSSTWCRRQHLCICILILVYISLVLIAILS